MLNLGIVEFYKGEIKVRILVNNGAMGQAGSTPTKDLPTPIVDSREKDGYKEGDTVVVGYVYDNVAYPVILFPYGDKEPTAGQRTEKLLKVIDTAELPENTTIGKIVGSELKNLKGLDYSLVVKIRQLEDDVSALKKLNTNLL